MELEHLKSIWQNQSASAQTPTEEALQQWLKQNSATPIARIRRNMRWEMGALLLMIPLLLWYVAKGRPNSLVPTSIMLVVLFLGYCLYYYFKHRLLTNMECVTCEVRSNLAMQVKQLDQFIRGYFWIGTLLTPLVFFLTAWISYHFDGPLLQHDQLFWSVFAGIGLVVTASSYYLNKWYVRKLYGQHLDRLKQVLKEMDNM